PGGLSRRALGSLEAAAAVAGSLRGDAMGLGLQLVSQPVEARNLRRARAVRERLREQPVREPRVARQERAVQVRPHDPAGPAALVAALAVVAEARDDAAERLGARVQVRPAGVVLEARECPFVARLTLALQQPVAGHPAVARDRLEREDARAGHVLA